MLRSPTHSPTIPLTQVHLQFSGDRSTGAQINRKLYHDHYHQSQQYKLQQQQQPRKREQLQQLQQQYLISKTAEEKFLPPVRVATTEIKLSDDSNSDSSSSGGDSNREIAAVATTATTTATLVTNINFNLNKNKTTTAATTSSLTNDTVGVSGSCCGNSQFGKKAKSSPTLSASSPLVLSPFLATKTTTATTTAAKTSASAITLHSMSPTSQTPSRTSLFDSCHRKIRLIGGGPVAFLGGLVAKARRKERDGDQNSTDTKLYLEESVLERKLPEADLKALVDLPAGLDYNEWLASHTLALFEHVNLVYGTVSEFCTPSGCPDMTGPGNRTYLWFDEKGKKTRVAAPQYIDYVMTFTQKTVSDESIFPTKYANEFPSSFESIARKILRLQFHVIAHLYAAHFREIALLGLHTHLNLTFAHLTALHRRFNLIDEKETDVLRDLEVALRLTDDSNHRSSSSSSSNNPQQQQGSNSDSGTYDTGTNYQSGYAAGHGNNSHHQYAGTGGNANVNSSSNSTMGDDATAIDGDASSQPICTQPEAKVGGGISGGGTNNVFGGGGGLMGGILGDFTGSEFSDTSRYCTSAVPSSSSANNTNGAGALQLNFNNNYNAHAHQHHLQHHHHQQQQQQHQHQHNIGGILQCSSTTTPSPHNTTTA